MASTTPSAFPRPTARRAARWATLALALLTAAAGCQRAKKGADNKTPVSGGTVTGTPTSAAVIDLDSKDILARTELATESEIKHVLIGWKGMGRSTSERSNADAAKLAKDLVAQLKADPSKIDALMKQYSEDPGSKDTGRIYPVTPEAGLVAPFKALGLRLKLGEVGIVKTDFGYHVMLRVAPPPPDPLESAEILGRPAGTAEVSVQHVLIGWKDTPSAAQGMSDPRAQTRTKADADKLALEILAKVKAGEDMAGLMKQYSEDPGSKDNAQVYPVSPGGRMVPPFQNLSLRLAMGEAGMVKTDFGWHIIKRVTPPPPPPPPPPPTPDKLDSVAILARQPVTEKAKVKHILLGWTDVNAGDPRGAKRTRAELEALVKKTVADLKKGAKIEPLMKSLSEDPGSAAAGTSYDVDPAAGLVAPFKNLSLRLKLNEVGIVKTQFGIHIIQRTE